MNYSCLVTGAVIMFATIYYFVRGKKEYHGPVFEVDIPTTSNAKNLLRAVDT